MTDELAVPATASPPVLRRYDVGVLTDEGLWRELGTFESDHSRGALDAYLDGFDPVITDATVFRVIQRGDYGMARRYVVRPVLSVFDYEWASESAFEETPSGGGGS